MSKYLIGIILAVLIVGGGIATAVNRQNQKEEAAMMADKKAMQSSESESDNPETSPNPQSEVQSLRSSGAQEVAFKNVDETYAYAKEGRAVIFFHAPWCPTCQAAQRDLDKNISQLPKDVVIVKTDYDTTKELQRKYGVTYQHTWVQVDSNGTALTKWNGGGVEDINNNLKAL